jgi:hypothetical protein
LHEVAQQHRAQAAGSVGGANQGDAAWREKQMQVSDGHGSTQHLKAQRGTAWHWHQHWQHRPITGPVPCAKSTREQGLQSFGATAVKAAQLWPVLEQVIGRNSGKQAMHMAHKSESLA